LGDLSLLPRGGPRLAGRGARERGVDLLARADPVDLSPESDRLPGVAAGDLPVPRSAEPRGEPPPGGAPRPRARAAGLCRVPRVRARHGNPRRRGSARGPRDRGGPGVGAARPDAGRRPRLRAPFAACALVCVVAVVAYRYLHLLPVFGLTRFALAWALLLPFFTAVLAGIGWDTLATSRTPRFPALGVLALVGAGLLAF